MPVEFLGPSLVHRQFDKAEDIACFALAKTKLARMSVRDTNSGYLEVHFSYCSERQLLAKESQSCVSLLPRAKRRRRPTTKVFRFHNKRKLVETVDRLSLRAKAKVNNSLQLYSRIVAANRDSGPWTRCSAAFLRVGGWPQCLDPTLTGQWRWQPDRPVRGGHLPFWAVRRLASPFFRPRIGPGLRSVLMRHRYHPPPG